MQGKTLARRKQLEANRTPNDYLRGIGKEIYDHESGMTPEDWLAFAITNLQEQNQAIDDDVAAYNTGGYFSRLPARPERVLGPRQSAGALGQERSDRSQ